MHLIVNNVFIYFISFYRVLIITYDLYIVLYALDYNNHGCCSHNRNKKTTSIQYYCNTLFIRHNILYNIIANENISCEYSICRCCKTTNNNIMLKETKK